MLMSYLDAMAFRRLSLEDGDGIFGKAMIENLPAKMV